MPEKPEQYVGMAPRGRRLLRQMARIFRHGHGGNVGIKNRDPSNYRVSNLETVGSGLAATAHIQSPAGNSRHEK
ncbi:hypothetical protein CPY51_21655 [Rhizobium tubonense]|uniref:Uncharacterized protein n=1 Tax=Rhizobium tubonense TaxID=484088 RepID=A0A2W4D0I4_9HYPH|nr:hypothetical protein CPY51_21655 [Rhizobium tubonense]